MASKIKVGMTVAPKHVVGKVVEISTAQIVIEVPDRKSDTGIRAVKLTLQQAQLRGTTLEQLLDDSVIQVEIKDGQA